MLMGVSEDYDGYYRCHDHVGNVLSSCRVIINLTKIYRGLYFPIAFVYTVNMNMVRHRHNAYVHDQ